MNALEAKLRRLSVTTPTGCLLYGGTKGQDGYGQIGVAGRVWRVHRLSYEIFVGQIPPGLDIDHLCFNKTCWNPDHLRALCPIENRRRQRSAFKTHCKHGHPLSGSNLYMRGRQRQCRACNAAAAKRYKQRKTA